MIGIIAIVLSVLSREAVKYIVQQRSSISSAFDGLDPVPDESNLSMVGELGIQSMEQTQKEELLEYIAKQLGLKELGPVKKNERENITEYSLRKEGKNADTTVRLIGVAPTEVKGVPVENHYLHIELQLHNQIKDIEGYKKKIGEILKGIGTTNIESELFFKCRCNGKLTLKEKNHLTNQMISNLSGRVRFENRKEELYTVYAYSSALKEYISADNKKVNIQVAMNYDELHDETVVYVGYPILNGSY